MLVSGSWVLTVEKDNISKWSTKGPDLNLAQDLLNYGASGASLQRWILYSGRRVRGWTWREKCPARSWSVGSPSAPGVWIVSVGVSDMRVCVTNDVGMTGTWSITRRHRHLHSTSTACQVSITVPVLWQTLSLTELHFKSSPSGPYLCLTWRFV